MKDFLSLMLLLIYVLRCAMKGLLKVHDAGIIHQDIKCVFLRQYEYL